MWHLMLDHAQAEADGEDEEEAGAIIWLFKATAALR